MPSATTKETGRSRPLMIDSTFNCRFRAVNCGPPTSERLANRSLEREAEHHLRDPHEPRLARDLAERRAAGGDRDAVRLHPVEQVDHLELDLRRLVAAGAEAL